VPRVWRNERVLETCAHRRGGHRLLPRAWRGELHLCKNTAGRPDGRLGHHWGQRRQVAGRDIKQCRGFGYGARTLDKMLASSTEPTVANGAKILRACLQTGQYATKYVNIFDLKSGDIFLFPAPAPG